MMTTKTVNTVVDLNGVGSHTQNSSLDSVVTIDVSSSVGDAILIQATDQTVRYTIDGATDPTTSLGFVLYPDMPPILIRASEVRLLEESSGATVEYQFVTTGA